MLIEFSTCHVTFKDGLILLTYTSGDSVLFLSALLSYSI